MITSTIDLQSGGLFINGHLFNFKTEDDYLKSIKKIGYREETPINIDGFIKHSIFYIYFGGIAFHLEFIYKNKKLEKFFFTYLGSECAKYSYDSMTENLNNDKKALTNKLISYLAKQPEKKLKSKNIFIYEWGEIIVSESPEKYSVLLRLNYY